MTTENHRTGMTPDAFQRAVLDHLHYTARKDISTATPQDLYIAIAHTLRDRLTHRWHNTQQAQRAQNAKRVCYLSAEFLLGRAMAQNLLNLGLYDIAESWAQAHDLTLPELLGEEVDPGLGNGGLGRLAACFMDSLATLKLPAMGYGIRYEFGIFEQGIEDGRQVERADDWLHQGNPWEHARHEDTVSVPFYGRVVETLHEDGELEVSWVDTKPVLGIPHDMPIAGFQNDFVNTLRLWSARAPQELDLKAFNEGAYQKAAHDKTQAEAISRVLYPNDNSPEGRELRLKQQYFFVCCSIADIIREYKKTHDTFEAFPDQVAIQLNDTHPAITVAELMRVFVDTEGLSWESAWDLTTRTTAYTNHTLLPEALEKWPVWMFERLLPRHLSIIYEINRRFLDHVRDAHPEDTALISRLSIIEEGEERRVRMAHLATVGSHSINGVAALHSRLITTNLMPDFYALWPERFNNKTNGVTPRRWLLQCNPQLARAITARVGEGWVTDLDRLQGLKAHTHDPEFQQELFKIKRHNKELLARIIQDACGVLVSPDAIFDVQVKRIHQYKRQLLNALHIISMYWRLKHEPSYDITPRVFIFGGKAAPGYWMAKEHIKLINDIAQVINHDPDIRDRLKVIFLPNYNVSLAQRIIPAADVSEQISMAGKEASGTGNMKFSMNGALTVGTLDGANVEIREEVSAENFFLFGLNADESRALKTSYRPRDFIERSDLLHNTLQMLSSGVFSAGDPERFRAILEDIHDHDDYLVCADFDDYVAIHDRIDRVYRVQTDWYPRVVHNIASMGKFSSDRTIAQYAQDIWDLKPITARRTT